MEHQVGTIEADLQPNVELNTWLRLKQIMMSKLGKLNMLAVSTGLVYLWFGALKFFPQVSPAEVLAKETISGLTLGLMSPDISIILLALLETGIGLALIFNFRVRQVAILALVHMACTFAPLFFFPDDMFVHAPYQLTLTGQYIIKNLIIVCVLLTIVRRERVKGEM